MFVKLPLRALANSPASSPPRSPERERFAACHDTLGAACSGAVDLGDWLTKLDLHQYVDKLKAEGYSFLSDIKEAPASEIDSLYP